MAREKIRGNNAPTLTTARRLKLDKIIDLYRGGPDEYRNNWKASFSHIYPRFTTDSAIRRGAYDALHHKYTQKKLSEFAEKSAAKADFNQDRVLREIAAIALFDVRKLIGDDGKPKPLSELDDATAAAVAGVKFAKVSDDFAVLEYKIADKNTALEKLMRHLGLYEKDNDQQNTSLAAALEAGIQRVKDLNE